MKKLINLLLLFPILAIAQTQTQNYIKTKTYKIPTTTTIASPTVQQASQNINYFDGLGRPIQQIAHGQSATGKDIVTQIEYDAFGRQAKEYLPYASSQNSLDYLNPTTLTTNLQNQYQAWYGDMNPYSEKQVEASPLNRVLKQPAPGNDWKIGSGHEIKMDYQTNNANDNVKMFSVNSNWNPSSKLYDIPTALTPTTYADFQLYKTITYDENTPFPSGGAVGGLEEFKDKEGKVILKKNYSINNKGIKEEFDTYYIYDQYGNLTFVLPPAVNTTTTITNTILDGLCYQYKYDYRNRLVEKKLPGKQWEFIVYDKLDRVVATGPANSPFSDNSTSKGWLITKYDAFSRPVYTGWTQATTINAAERATIQTNINALTNFNENKTTAGTIDGIACFYTNNIAVTTGVFKLLTVNYFDDYNFPNAPTTIPATITNNNDQAVYYNNSTQKPKGMPTGSWVRVLQTTANNNGETSYTLYDNKARPVRTYTKNYLGGYTQTDSKIDFAGKTLFTETKHKRLASSTELLTREVFTYTPQDRLLTQTHQINNSTIQLITHNTYTELGQLKNKKVGGAFPSVGGVPQAGWLPLQSVDYQYNIRGWLTAINNVNDLTDPLSAHPSGAGGLGQDLFAFKINYNTLDNNQTGVVPLYNGNISETRWRTKKDNVTRSYGYSYDNLNRLINAQYIRPTNSMFSNPNPADIVGTYDETLSYDKNGNIQTLVRNGGLENQTTTSLTTPKIDILAYSYDQLSPNKLVKVDDTSASADGFKDGTNPNDDYDYDDNGNMIKDENKGITTIKYNHLNLPTEILFSGNNRKINYLYTATGQKVQKIVNEGVALSITDYLGGYQYNNDVLHFFPTTEGYVKNTVVGGANSYDYVFNYTDHLGNIRLSYGIDPANPTVLTMFEENDYYPFGLKHKNYNYALKEIQEKKETIIIQEAVSATEFAEAIPEIKEEVFNKKSLQKEQEYFEKMSAIKNQEIAIFSNLVPNSGYLYRMQKKEWQDELDLNVFDFGARQYDPALVRTTTHDPLAEKFYHLSPQSFLNNNPMSFIDPTGMEADGWIKSIANGVTTMTYDANVNTTAEATAAGYSNVEAVYKSATVSASDGSYSYNLGADGLVTNADGNKMVSSSFMSMTTEGGTKISSFGLVKPIEQSPMASGACTPMEFSSPAFAWGAVLKPVFGAIGAAWNSFFGSAASTTAEASGSVYSVAYETTLSSELFPGLYRGAHFKAANTSLSNAMASDAAFSSSMSSLGVSIPRSATGTILGKSPTNWVWHHSVETGVMQLVPKVQHTQGSIFWNTMHPNGVGGYAIWGK